MKSSRRAFLPWDAVAGAGMAMPALAHTIHVLTDEYARTFYCPASHSLGNQPLRAVPAKFVNPLAIPLMIRKATGSITRTDIESGAETTALPSVTHSRQKNAIRKWVPKSTSKTRHVQITAPVLRKQEELH